MAGAAVHRGAAHGAAVLGRGATVEGALVGGAAAKRTHGPKGVGAPVCRVPSRAPPRRGGAPAVDKRHRRVNSHVPTRQRVIRRGVAAPKEGRPGVP